MPAEASLPDALRTALAASPEAEARFHRLAPSCRREYAGYVEAAKKEETRARRAQKTVAMLLRKDAEL
jgi:uncharacterized protein YdeI (YjbR/CyaY-like superfamily)